MIKRAFLSVSLHKFLVTLILWSAMLSFGGGITTNAQAKTGPEFAFDLAWDSQYISEGRDNLDKGGIVWGVASVTDGDLVTFVALGRGDQTHYIEWNFGLEYTIHLTEKFEATLGYQRLEFYGDDRGSDNEVFSSLTYTGVDWLIPAIHYTYATEAGGYFVEVSLHSPWDITDKLSITPYVLQGFDFQYVTEEHDGANHIQFGVEAAYAISDNIALSAHLSVTQALEDIKREASENQIVGNLNETYGGVHLNWVF
jgi:hypothetical protein